MKTMAEPNVTPTMPMPMTMTMIPTLDEPTKVLLGALIDAIRSIIYGYDEGALELADGAARFLRRRLGRTA